MYMISAAQLKVMPCTSLLVQLFVILWDYLLRVSHCVLGFVCSFFRPRTKDDLRAYFILVQVRLWGVPRRPLTVN